MLKVFEYKCRVCENKYEYDRSDVLDECCGYPLVRIYSSVGIQFKGSGWHKTDYKE